MSVPKSKRGESSMEFLHNARELQLFTLRKVTKFPKRYTFYLSQPIAQMASHIYTDVVRANAIYPKNQQDAQMRRTYLIHALSEIKAIVSQIELACELFGLDPMTVEQWMRMIDREKQLIEGLEKRDWERYKNLKY